LAEKSAKKRNRRGLPLIVLSASLLFQFSSQAQQSVDYSIQANIIYHFTKYINWPETQRSGDFIIGVVGESPLFDALKVSMNNKLAGTQNIVVRKIAASAKVFNCQILFISDEESGSIKRIAAGTSGGPILLVTESEGMARKGSCINFIIVDDHLKLEINKINIEKRNLGIASELLQLGTPVK
jgi:hypothetical protein